MPSTCGAETAVQTQPPKKQLSVHTTELATEHAAGQGEERDSSICCNFWGHVGLMQKFSCGGEKICGRSILKDCSQRG